MSRTGKIVGGIIGFALGGPIGATAGVLFGHAFDLDAENDYAVLDCSSDDSDEHIKKQYRKLVCDFHPDKIASRGLSEAFTAFAGDKFLQIQKAYEKIKRVRNMA